LAYFSGESYACNRVGKVRRPGQPCLQGHPGARIEAQFHDAVAEAINCQSVQDVAKVLGTRQNRLFRFLRQEGLLMPNNLPYQQHIDAEYFRVVERQYNEGWARVIPYTRTLVTGKGLAFIQRRLSSREKAVG